MDILYKHTNCEMDATNDFDHILNRLLSSVFGEKFKMNAEQKLFIKSVYCDIIDVFAQLPTGFGKSIIYQLIPRVKAALLQILKHVEMKCSK